MPENAGLKIHCIKEGTNGDMGEIKFQGAVTTEEEEAVECIVALPLIPCSLNPLTEKSKHQKYCHGK